MMHAVATKNNEVLQQVVNSALVYVLIDDYIYIL